METRITCRVIAGSILCVVLSLTGCGTFLVGDEGVVAPYQATSLEDRVYPGVTSRSDINKLLGTPVTSSETWRIELYRTDNDDAYTIWGGMLIFPLPIWSETATQAIYALVTYDKNWKVSDFGTGYFVEEIHESRLMQQKDAVAGGFRLEVGSVLRELEPESECLYAPKAVTEAVLSAQPQAGTCTIYLANSGDNARLFVDGDIYFNPRGTLRRGFLAVSVLPGKHEIKVDPYFKYGGSLDYKGEATREVNCSEGQRLFVEIKPDISYEPSLFRRSTLTAEFVVSNEPLDVFKAFPLILYHNEKWIGPDKPNFDQPVR